MDDADSIPRVLILGAAGCGKSTILKALATGAVPARAIGRTVGAHVETVLLRPQQSDAAPTGAIDPDAAPPCVAMIAVDASSDQRRALHVYMDGVDGVIVAYEAGRPASWQEALDLLQEFAGHFTKRKIQNADRRAHDVARKTGTPVAADSAIRQAGEARAAQQLGDLPILLLACKADRAGNGGSGQGHKGAAANHAGSADWAAALVEWVVSTCLCRPAGWLPLPRAPPFVLAGSVTRLKVRIPLIPAPGLKPAQAVAGTGGGVLAWLRPRPPRVASLDLQVAGVSCRALAGTFRPSGSHAGAAGRGGRAGEGRAGPGPKPGLTTLNWDEPPHGLTAPMDVLESFVQNVAIRKRIQVEEQRRMGAP